MKRLTSWEVLENMYLSLERPHSYRQSQRQLWIVLQTLGWAFLPQLCSKVQTLHMHPSVPLHSYSSILFKVSTVQSPHALWRSHPSEEGTLWDQGVPAALPPLPCCQMNLMLFRIFPSNWLELLLLQSHQLSITSTGWKNSYKDNRTQTPKN